VQHRAVDGHKTGHYQQQFGAREADGVAVCARAERATDTAGRGPADAAAATAAATATAAAATTTCHCFGFIHSQC